MEADIGIVYCLTNPSYKHDFRGKTTVKIGMTRKDDVQERMKELFSTGVPTPFVCEVAARVQNPEWVERQLQLLFSDDRITHNREFFHVNPCDVSIALSLAGGEDVTPDRPSFDDDF